MKVSFHKTFHHFFWWTKKKTHPSPTNLLLFFLVNSTFLNQQKRGPDYASTGLSSAFPGCLPGGWVTWFSTVPDLSSPGGYDSFSPRPKLQSKGCSAGCFWDVLSFRFFIYGKKHGMAKNRPKFSYILIYTYIYWYTHVINTHVMHKMDFLKNLKNQQYIYYTLQN